MPVTSHFLYPTALQNNVLPKALSGEWIKISNMTQTILLYTSVDADITPLQGIFL